VSSLMLPNGRFRRQQFPTVPTYIWEHFCKKKKEGIKLQNYCITTI
jgi:hypothetical protein